MKHCTSCGSPIPDGQGKSCSMCYGDIAHGTDGYYENWAREQERLQAQENYIRSLEDESNLKQDNSQF